MAVHVEEVSPVVSASLTFFRASHFVSCRSMGAQGRGARGRGAAVLRCAWRGPVGRRQSCLASPAMSLDPAHSGVLDRRMISVSPAEQAPALHCTVLDYTGRQWLDHSHLLLSDSHTPVSVAGSGDGIDESVRRRTEVLASVL